jgi:tetratricopeptide (TPR) repeat protein
MNQRFTCAHGHEWEVASSATAATQDALPVCPTCGLAGRFADGQTRTDHGSAAGAAGPCPAPTVGGFAIERELGRGGMGVVYLARDRTLGRLVALKMVLAGGHAGESARSRFATEARTIAGLQHPNIVALHEVGEADGQLFCALEYVAGGSLADRLDGTPLPAREAARLLIPLAQAVQTAHAAGVIHRDLKPANILLTADASGNRPAAAHWAASVVPKITDFGLAKHLTTSDGPTQTGAVLGTPSYMAPEQASGKSRAAGPGVDVYALGAVLYELLTGRPPFRGETPLDTIMQVSLQEPVPPRQLQPKCPRDLETVALKCLQKEPHKRYASAGEFGEDLQRFLGGEPIRARPVGPLGRSWRWARRNPAIATLAATLFVVMSAGLVITTALLLRAEREHQQALGQEARAKAMLQKSIQVIDGMLTRVGEERLAYVPQFEDERRLILEDAVKFYHEFLQAETHDPELRREYGRAHDRLGRVFLGLGRYEQARDAFGQAVQIHEQLAADFPGDARHRNDLAIALMHGGGILRLLNHPDRADPDYDRARRLAEDLVASAPGESEYRVTLAEMLAQLGFHSLQKRRIDLARDNLRKSVDEWGNLAAAHPDEFRYALERARTRGRLGYVLLSIGDLGKAETTLAATIEDLERLRSSHPQQARAIDPIVGDARLNLAAVFVQTRRPARAEEPLARGLAVYEKMVTDYAKQPGFRLTLARGYETAGMLARAQNKPDQAEASFLKATALLEQLGRSHPEAFFHGIILRLCYSDLVQLYRSTGKADEALAIFDRAVENAREDLRGAADASVIHIEYPRWLILKSEFLGDLKRHSEAVPLLRESIEYLRAHPSQQSGTDGFISSARASLAVALLRSNDYRAALVEAEGLLDPAPRSPDTIYNVACVYSLAAVAVGKDESLPTDRRATLAEAYVARAAELVKQLHRDGYFRPPARVAHFWQDTDLDALRAHRAFRPWAEHNLPLPKR